MKLKQFDILLVQCSPTVGREQSGLRPCVVIESNAFGTQKEVTIVAPLTSNLKRIFSSETLVHPSGNNGLSLESKILFRQIRVIDKSRIVKKLGSLEPKHRASLLNSLELLFDLRQDFVT